MPKNTKTRSNEVLSQLLVRCRAERRLSLEDVAAELKVSHATIANIESGLKSPRRTTRLLLEDFLRKYGYLPKLKAA